MTPYECRDANMKSSSEEFQTPVGGIFESKEEWIRVVELPPNASIFKTVYLIHAHLKHTLLFIQWLKIETIISASNGQAQKAQKIAGGLGAAKGPQQSEIF